MDPKLSNLDPKLQDAYHRVMGSAPAGNQPQGPQPTPPAQNPAPAPAPDPTPPQEQVSTQPEPPPPPAPVENSDINKPIESAPSDSSGGKIPGVNSTLAFNADDSHKNVGTTPVKKGGLHIMPVVIGLGIMVLLVAYTFVWIILFNVQVPFLPEL